jgi:putative polyhydroxyalkanoic acid system protein
MSQPIIVSVPHRLGKEEAVRRLKSGLERSRAAVGSQFSVLQEEWSGEHLTLRIALFGQATEGMIDVAEDHIRIEVQVPWFIGMLADKAKALIQRQGQLMLEKK